jgi:hypothetical protein
LGWVLESEERSQKWLRYWCALRNLPSSSY